MRSTRHLLIAASFALALVVSTFATLSSQQGVDPAAAMHWRQIGPTRAGRARPLAGVPSQPNVFYVGFDNGGVWRSTDYGSTWTPIFDRESTGSIGAIAVAPSNPRIIYVGTGAAIIRPDLAQGDGVYKSIDAGQTWTKQGLADSRMIAQIDVDPRDPNRLFVAALGHPYGPNAERGVFRSTDGGKSFQKVLYKDEYTSANDVRIDPADPNTVYAALWIQQQSYIEGGAFGGAGGGIFKSTDGGSTWKQLTEGLPDIIEANLGVATSYSKVIYAMVAGGAPPAASAGGQAGRGGRGGPPSPAATPGQAGRGGGGGGGGIGLYKSLDGGEHWFLAARGPSGTGTRTPDPRPLGRIGGGDLPPVVVDPKNPDVVYSCSVVLWRSDDGGVTWSAVRGAPGGDDYQGLFINPNNTDIILAVADQGAVISGNGGESWSNWYTQPTAARLSRDDRQRVPVSRVQRPAGLRVGVRGQPRQRRRDHVPRLASRSASRNTARPRPIRRTRISSMAAPATTSRSTTAGPARSRTSARTSPCRTRRARPSRATCGRCPSSGRPSIRTCSSTRRTRCS